MRGRGEEAELSQIAVLASNGDNVSKSKANNQNTEQENPNENVFERALFTSGPLHFYKFYIPLSTIYIYIILKREKCELTGAESNGGVIRSDEETERIMKVGGMEIERGKMC